MTDTRKKSALVLGAGGFIGGHMVDRLKGEGYWVCLLYTSDAADE